MNKIKINPLLYLWCGAFGGAVARYKISTMDFLTSTTPFPINTLVINLSGVFLMAFIMTCVVKLLPIHDNLRLGITTGFMGAFTTFSTLCKESVTLMMNGYYGIGVLYLLGSALLGLFTAFLAAFFARLIIKTIDTSKAHPSSN